MHSGQPTVCQVQAFGNPMQFAEDYRAMYEGFKVNFIREHQHLLSTSPDYDLKTDAPVVKTVQALVRIQESVHEVYSSAAAAVKGAFTPVEAINFLRASNRWAADLPGFSSKTMLLVDQNSRSIGDWLDVDLNTDGFVVIVYCSERDGGAEVALSAEVMSTDYLRHLFGDSWAGIETPAYHDLGVHDLTASRLRDVIGVSGGRVRQRFGDFRQLDGAMTYRKLFFVKGLQQDIWANVVFGHVMQYPFSGWEESLILGDTVNFSSELREGSPLDVYWCHVLCNQVTVRYPYAYLG